MESMNSSDMNLSTSSDEFREVSNALAEMELTSSGERMAVTRLSGGVSCDVYRVEIEGRPPLVVKRALPKLRVGVDWRAPPARSQAEGAWIELVSRINPHWVPKVLGVNRERHLFAMEYLPPERYPIWKSELAVGRIDVDFAARVGAALADIHAATAGRSDVAQSFANDAQFHALRLEPYLLFTAERHPDVAQTIRGVSEQIARSRIALMQGDISPKNILCGPGGPVFLDAETACYGDPAFDLAFCLNHLLLKSVWHPQWRERYAESYFAMFRSYHLGVTWEAATALDRRTARLLPMLLLARVDGKSPVEYLTRESDKAFVRGTARAMIENPAENLDELAGRYFAGSR
jgi:aminoglycoside phosphotransferase (APT) family kinase protein